MATKRATYLGRAREQWARDLQQPDPLRRRLAAYALGQLGPAARPAAPRLRALLRDDVDFVRVWAAASLVRIEPKRRDALRVLIAALDEPAAFVRSLGAWFLGRLGPDFAGIDTALEPLATCAAQDPDGSVRTEASLALKRLRNTVMPESRNSLWSMYQSRSTRRRPG